MLWWLLGLSFAVSAQELDLKAIQELDASLPDYDIQNESTVNPAFEKEKRSHLPFYKKVSFEEIRESGTENVYIAPFQSIYRIGNDRKHQLTESLTAKVFRLPDESGFKYLLSDDGKVRYKVHMDQVTPINQELALYEPPLRYTPAPPILVREFDRSLTIRPEVSVYTGLVQGEYMQDLFLNSDGTGHSQQYGVHAFTDWKIPVKIGGALHFETANFETANGGRIYYTSVSFGPQFKSPDFEIASFPLRAQAQLRYGPFARARSESDEQEQNFKFTSTDLLTSLEHPISNRFGSFVLGAYLQLQWLTIKDQKELVSVEASNAINRSFGVSFSQVFE